ncbi:MAG: hypothetical protein L6R42_006764 [Xanthoria sp. 1 TBL-2021]|nr:MAG: hypothetical protein L6R42_006764 [Xanthoria sp. 1 TBL-2021]
MFPHSHSAPFSNDDRATVTVTKSSTCSVATPIVKNGDFESGSLAPCTLSTPYGNYDPQYLSHGVKGPGFGGSKYGFIANNKNANSYVELNLEQSLTVCPGAKYNIAVKFYITNPGYQPSKKNKRQVNPNKQVYIYAYVDDVSIKGNLDSDPAGPPIVWRTLTGSFTASSNQARLKVAFVATDSLGVEWGVDNVVVTPA